MALGKSPDRVVLVPYDPAWPAEFEAERERMRAALGGLPLEIEHVGSTSVPGLAAKPVLDILAGRPPGSDPAPYVAALQGVGYVHRGELGIPGRNYFVRDDARGLRTHHVHMFALDHGEWRRHLDFRDLLRRDPEAAAAYEALKRELAARHADDYGAYADAKSPFIAEALRAARAERRPIG